ncbi:hypothetical protein Q73A0000_07395 [Kaistella flava (ex Peng et al. 2021)]|uniref:DUF6438 domain-containing protein n=1 Tax=Kaistella flava (ex Peng et al. 2021) TaxID=2038776 RepID=A0A7M2Y7F8_9FLAO|nr:DUF6438 domain-containing protein [Kaistella flava (ex Peng et al. 2021)]QOW10198.1 hypothetical protein Q73A0000_07395 [Kaistella flava (ex Peng et al. 2021)]
MKYVLSLFSFLLIVSCATTKTTSKYSKIEYSAGPCFGFCPIFKMTINSDRTATFEAERFNFSRDTESQKSEGSFQGKIDQEHYNQLISLLDSLPKDLKDDYGNKNVTDLPTSNLTLNYQDGHLKKVQDYGKRGTPELVKVYQFFEDLKTNQNWTKIE